MSDYKDATIRALISKINSQLANVIYTTGEAIPTSGTWTSAQKIYNSSPAAGEYLGWVCVTTGTACGDTWVQTTAYTIGNLRYANGKVYRCKVAGTSSSTAPSHTTGDATDGTVTWTYVDTLAVFKGFGLIQS